MFVRIYLLAFSFMNTCCDHCADIYLFL